VHIKQEMRVIVIHHNHLEMRMIVIHNHLEMRVIAMHHYPEIRVIVMHHYPEIRVIVMYNYPEVRPLETVHILLYPDIIPPHADMVAVLDHLEIVRLLALFMLILVAVVVDHPRRVT
jgi:hypothetical protein